MDLVIPAKIVSPSVVEKSTRNLKIEGSNPAPDIGRQNSKNKD